MSQAKSHCPERHRPADSTHAAPAAHDVELPDDLDALLDEIDTVLEKNALEITRRFIQRGGQ